MYQEAVHLLQDGNISNIPMLTKEDLLRAQELCGNPPEYVIGRAMKNKVSRAIVDNDLILDEKRQTLHTDVMPVDGQRFLVTPCEPLSLTLQVHIEVRALQGQLDFCEARILYQCGCTWTRRVCFRVLPLSLKMWC